MNATEARRNRVRVFIATTEGPVAVQKITAEDPDVPSVACRDGTTEVLAISRDYTRFVDRGTGLVARLTGHGAYRLDLDRPVDGGRSWQLPVLLAHLLDVEGRLAGPEEPADLTLLATGEVDREQRVRPVGQIEQKLSAARALIERHAARGQPLVVLVPEGERSSDLASRLPTDGEGVVRLLAWNRVERLAALVVPSAPEAVLPAASPASGMSMARSGDRVHAGLGPPPDDRALTQPAPPPGGANGTRSGGHAGGRRQSRSLLSGPERYCLCCWSSRERVRGRRAVAAWWTGPRYWEALRREGDYEALERDLRKALIPPLAERYRQGLQARIPPPESLVFGIVERRTTDGGSCSGRAFRNAGRETLGETPLSALKPGFFRSQQGASLCEAIYRVANEGGSSAWSISTSPYGRFSPDRAIRSNAAPLRRAAALPPGASLALEVELDRQPARPLGADLLVLAVPSPAPQLRRAFESATAGKEAAELPGLLDLTALPGLGLTVKGASHAILR